MFCQPTQPITAVTVKSLAGFVISVKTAFASKQRGTGFKFLPGT